MRLNVCAIFALAACVFTSAASAGQYMGKPFPDFDAVDPISKRKFQLSDFRGKVVLVDFWATWCGPCRAEMPNIKTVYNKYKDKGFEIISISLDQDAGKFRQYVGSNGMDWVHVMDGGGWKTRLAKKYGINSIPAMFLLNHDGVCISDSARGSRLESAVQDAISKLPATPPKQDEQPSSARGPATIDRIRADLEQLAAQLETTQQTPNGLVHRIQDVRKALDETIAADAGEGDRCAQLKSEVIRLRTDVFAMGLLNGVAVKMPGTNDTGEDDACITAGRQALDTMEQSVISAGKTLEVIATQVAEFRDQLASEPITLQQARQKFANLNGNANRAMQKWASAWQTQLNDLDAMLAPLGESDALLNARLAAVEKSISDLRVRLMSQSRSSRNDLLLRDEYQKIRSDLAEMCAKVCAAPAECKMPANVYAGRSAEDPLAVKEVESQLIVAGQAAKQMKPLVAKSAEQGKQLRMTFARKVTALQNDLKEAGNDAAAVEALREPFVAMCGEILAAAVE